MNTLTSIVPFLGGLGLGLILNSVRSKWLASEKPGHDLDDDGYWETDESSDDSEDEDSAVAPTLEDGMVVSTTGDMKMVLVIRTDLGMGKGKAAAQCAHAAVGAYKIASRKCPAILRKWDRTGSRKVTVKIEGDEQLLTVMAVAQSLGLVATVIQDAGRTQIEAGSRTVVAVGPGPEALIDQVTGDLKLY